LEKRKAYDRAFLAERPGHSKKKIGSKSPKEVIGPTESLLCRKRALGSALADLEKLKGTGLRWTKTKKNRRGPTGRRGRVLQAGENKRQAVTHSLSKERKKESGGSSVDV